MLSASSLGGLPSLESASHSMVEPPFMRACILTFTLFNWSQCSGSFPGAAAPLFALTKSACQSGWMSQSNPANPAFALEK